MRGWVATCDDGEHAWHEQIVGWIDGHAVVPDGRDGFQWARDLAHFDSVRWFPEAVDA
jgi:hypothetical protein